MNDIKNALIFSQLSGGAKGKPGDKTANSVFPTNFEIYDNAGKPSVMVYIPKFKMSDVIDGASGTTHPAFIVNGVEKDGVYISKYLNVVENGKAYSLPARDPAVNITIGEARAACESKGAGWHLMTAMEWGAITLWCKKNGYAPRGNNDNGKDKDETMYKAVPTAVNSSGKTTRTATGTGPVEWAHNKQLDGIYDLNGNVWEWSDGTRLVYGELQIYDNGAWKAVDGTTGALITPNGSGTTANTLKLDRASNIWRWVTAAPSDVAAQNRHSWFSALTSANSVYAAARERLYALCALPDGSGFDYTEDAFWANNGASEEFMVRGNTYSNKGDAGIFSLSWCYDNSTSNGITGFRAAYFD